MTARTDGPRGNTRQYGTSECGTHLRKSDKKRRFDSAMSCQVGICSLDPPLSISRSPLEAAHQRWCPVKFRRAYGEQARESAMMRSHHWAARQACPARRFESFILHQQRGRKSCMRVPFRPSYQSLTAGKTAPAVKPWPPDTCRYSSMVEHLPSKQVTRVRFPLPAPGLNL